MLQQKILTNDKQHEKTIVNSRNTLYKPLIMNINPFIDLIVAVLNLYGWVLVLWIIISWLISFDIINRHSPFVAKISEVLFKLTEPVLRRVRRYMPDLGAIDISPIVVFLFIHFLTNVLHTYFYTY
jgi:YggT family protein